MLRFIIETNTNATFYLEWHHKRIFSLTLLQQSFLMFYQSLIAGLMAGENNLDAIVSTSASFSDFESEYAGVKITENFFS